MSSTEAESDLFRLVREDGWEIHYAPVSGAICVMKNGEMRSPSNWPQRHKLMDEFVRNRSAERLRCINTVDYGHIMLHGHSGRVDIYAWDEREKSVPNRIVRVIVAGINPDGESDLFFCQIAIPDGVAFDLTTEGEQRHKWAALLAAKRDGWAPCMVFDDASPAFMGLSELAEWSTFQPIRDAFPPEWKNAECVDSDMILSLIAQTTMAACSDLTAQPFLTDKDLRDFTVEIVQNFGVNS